MAKYPNIKLTQKGLDMAINADKSKKLIYTHIGIGDGRLANNEDILNLTAMKSRKIYADISDINNDTNNQVTLETIVSNKVVTQGFYAREIGIYAKLGETGQEVLYGYANAGDNCDYMPDKTQPIDELKLRITLIVGNVDNVTAIVNSSIIFITLADCRREIARHNADPLAHGDFARKKDYYTKPEVDTKLNGKANTAHGNHVPSLESANNARFLRNDNTWQTITPNNIGAYHKSETYHKNETYNKSEVWSKDESYNRGSLWNRTESDARYYNKNEVNILTDQKVNTRVSKSGDTMTGTLTVPTIFTNDYIHCKGNGGILWDKYGGGFFMEESTTVLMNNSKNLYTGGFIKAEQGFKGNLEGNATSASRADIANVAEKIYTGWKNTKFNFEWKSGCPGLVWGTEDESQENMYVFSPNNFNVNSAKTSDNANKLQDWTLQNILDEFLNVWHANRAYAVGDIAYHKNLPSWARLECVVAGTTGNNTNVFYKSLKAGLYVYDGSVTWIIDDVRDGNIVGNIVGLLYIPDGYILADGRTVNRADYPRLVRLIDRCNFWTDNTESYRGLFGRGNGRSTFVLPNWIDRMMQYVSPGTIGGTIAAGLPNIKGTLYNAAHPYPVHMTSDGAFSLEMNWDIREAQAQQGTTGQAQHVTFDASKSNSIYGRSNTVQPAAIKMIPCIKY